MKQCVILVPAYQCEDTIGETLESIQKQGTALDRVDAVIVADDGSTDCTVEMAQRAWHVATPLEILRAGKNRGEYTNVNEAVARLVNRVEWFLILHADDIAKAEWLEAILDCIDATPAKVGSICCSWDNLNPDGKIILGDNRPTQGTITITGSMESVRDTLIRGCWWHISSSAIRVKTFQELGGLPKHLHQKGDWDFLLRLLGSGWNVEYIPRTLMVYYYNPAGVSSRAARHHDDIRERVQVIGWYRGALTSSDLIRVHVAELWPLMRRAVRSIAQLNFERLFAVPPTEIFVLRSLVQCLVRRQSRDMLFEKKQL